MKLAEFLTEVVISKGSLKKAAKEEAKGQHAADLKPHLDKIRDEKDFEKKREHARAMADAFKVGRKEEFLKTVNAAKTAADIDRIAYMAALKGEGRGVMK